MVGNQLRYVLVDVFARLPFAGNPLSVVLGADDLSTSQLQAIAREFNLSETTFPMALTAEDERVGADYRVRIFTAGTEVPFAGHPTLGTAWVLAQHRGLQSGSRLQACGAGLIAVDVPRDTTQPFELGAVPSDLSGPLPDAAAVDCARSVGLSPDDVAGKAFVAGCGLSFIHLPVRPEALTRAVPRVAPVGEVDLGGYRPRDLLIGLNVHTQPSEPSAGQGLSVRSRVFVPGPTEDPATGSAAVGLGVALVAAGRAGCDGITRYEIEQGAELGRPSYLSCRVEAAGGRASRCWVAGQVVPIGEGTIAVPAQ